MKEQIKTVKKKDKEFRHFWQRKLKFKHVTPTLTLRTWNEANSITQWLCSSNPPLQMRREIVFQTVICRWGLCSSWGGQLLLSVCTCSPSAAWQPPGHWTEWRLTCTITSMDETVVLYLCIWQHPWNMTENIQKSTRKKSSPIIMGLPRLNSLVTVDYLVMLCWWFHTRFQTSMTGFT